MTRRIRDIAIEVCRDWTPRRISPYALPYLDAMLDLNTLADAYGFDSAPEIVARFLANASSWKGETARRVKAELNTMRKEAQA